MDKKKLSDEIREEFKKRYEKTGINFSLMSDEELMQWVATLTNEVLKRRKR